MEEPFGALFLFFRFLKGTNKLPACQLTLAFQVNLTTRNKNSVAFPPQISQNRGESYSRFSFFGIFYIKCMEKNKPGGCIRNSRDEKENAP